MTVATELTRLMADRGISQSALARRIAVNHSTIQRWTSGERTPELAHLAAAATVLDLHDAAIARLVRAAHPTQETRS
jgi:transcriptional regulator with XRE-family HTH domain